PGGYFLQVVVHDSQGQSSSILLGDGIVTAASAPSPLTMSCPLPLSSVLSAGVSYAAVCLVSGGSPPYTMTPQGSPPIGLTSAIGLSTIRIAGTPTAAGAFQFGFTARDSSSPPQASSIAINGTVPTPCSLAMTASS